MTKGSRCKECGAELRLGSAPCPLCGADGMGPAKPLDTDADRYRANVRQLRRQLKKLRGGRARAS